MSANLLLESQRGKGYQDKGIGGQGEELAPPDFQADSSQENPAANGREVARWEQI
jgi:hypothetical protein